MEDKLMTATNVRNTFGGVSDMTLWRWLEDRSLGFPRPIIIQKRRYWRENEIQDWMDRQEVDS